MFSSTYSRGRCCASVRGYLGGTGAVTAHTVRTLHHRLVDVVIVLALEPPLFGTLELRAGELVVDFGDGTVGVTRRALITVVRARPEIHLLGLGEHLNRFELAVVPALLVRYTLVRRSVCVTHTLSLVDRSRSPGLGACRPRLAHSSTDARSSRPWHRSFAYLRATGSGDVSRRDRDPAPDFPPRSRSRPVPLLPHEGSQLRLAVGVERSELAVRFEAEPRVRLFAEDVVDEPVVPVLGVGNTTAEYRLGDALAVRLDPFADQPAGREDVLIRPVGISAPCRSTTTWSIRSVRRPAPALSPVSYPTTGTPDVTLTPAASSASYSNSSRRIPGDSAAPSGPRRRRHRACLPDRLGRRRLVRRRGSRETRPVARPRSGLERPLRALARTRLSGGSRDGFVPVEEVGVSGHFRVVSGDAGKPQCHAAAVEGDACGLEMGRGERRVEVGKRLDADQQGVAVVARQSGSRRGG